MPQFPKSVVVFEPNKPPAVVDLPFQESYGFTLESLQAVVGGYIEMVNISAYRPNLPAPRWAVAVCNEEGLLRNLPHNRIFYGTFLVCSTYADMMIGLTQDQIARIVALSWTGRLAR